MFWGLLEACVIFQDSGIDWCCHFFYVPSFCPPCFQDGFVEFVRNRHLDRDFIQHYFFL